MFHLLLLDFCAKSKWLYGDAAWLNVAKSLLSDGSLSMVIYRCMMCTNKYPVLFAITFVLLKLNSFLCGAVIGRGAVFGSPFVILHSVGIVINSKVVGGRDVYLESGVVIGETKRGCPLLGNDIFIGSGAKIIGSVSVGNNVTIGANAVVNASFPDNVVVAGVPAKIVRRKTLLENRASG